MPTRLTESAGQLLLRWPRSLLLVLLVLLGVLSARLPQLEVEVSSSSLLADEQPALRAWRDTAHTFQLPEQVMVSIASPGGLLQAGNRALLARLQDELAAVPGVSKVDSVLDAPLLQQVRGPLAQLETNRRTLRSPAIDYAAARRELMASPLFRELLIGADGRHCALLVTLHENAVRRVTVAALRAVLAPYAAHAEVEMSGAAIVGDEIEGALRADLERLPLLVLAVMLALIAAGTRRPPILEFACGGFALLTTAGLWQATYGVLGIAPAAALPIVVVISVSLAFTLRVSYKLHVSLIRSDDPHTALAATVQHALTASLPATGVLLLLATTLCLSPLLPVHELGALLLIGLLCAWLAAFGLGPCLLTVAKRRPQELSPVPLVVPARWLSVALASALAVAAIGGLPRFIQEAGLDNYLAPTSSARAGLANAERHFGGALSFDVVLNLPATAVVTAAPAVAADDPYRGAAADGVQDDTWFTSPRVQRIAAIHQWLARQPGIGRVWSLSSLLEVGQQLNDGVALSPFELNLMYKRLPRAVRRALIDPFVQPSHDQARIHVRMGDVPHDMTRMALLTRIEQGLKQQFNLKAQDYQLSGDFVIYAQMVDLLPPTLVVVGALGALASLALVILSGRTPRAASRLLTPTLIAALGVMGVAGWHNLRLDFITVCASGIAFALFVQIRTAGRRLIEAPAPAALKDGTAPPPVRDPYGSTVIGLGTVSVGAGLATLGTAAFVPTAHFGLLCGATVTLALLASQRVSGLRRRFD